MDIGMAIFGAILGSAGLFSFAQYLISRHDNKNTELVMIKKELTSIKKVQDETIIRVTRGELKDLIRDDPNNIGAILQVAEYYFIDLNGDAYVHAIFEKWAKEHDVPITWLPQLKKERSKK